MSESSQESRLLGALFRVPFQFLNQQIESGLIASGYTDLRPAHFEVFRHMAPGGARSTVLAERAQITKQSMGYLVDYLEGRGYVQRIPDPDDRRAKIVQFTEKGRGVNETAAQIIRRVEAEWADLIGGELMVSLREALEVLIHFLEDER
jgi:DNA-binding MarR family transcriptional regulator